MRATLLIGLMAVFSVVGALGAGEKKRFADDVSEWSSSTAPAPDIIPVGGSGQVNGDFVVSERNGVQVAIRASRRFFQNIDPLDSLREKNEGIYLADTGTSDGAGRATWNYDIHVDLRSAFGVAKGKTLDDYTLTLDTDIGETIFGAEVPLDLVEDFNLPPGVKLFQTSLNPKFGNPSFDADAEGTYFFTLTLTPETFNGAPITARMSVVVSDE